ncbi:MAG: carboxypeptidase regulatory-like domain-containing protein [Terracidiphilus sp.]
MHRSWIKWLIFAGVSVPWPASAQQTCANGTRVDGTVADPTGAVIPGARLQSASGDQAISDAAGHYVLPCIAASAFTVAARADGFRAAALPARGGEGETIQLNFKLEMNSVQTDVRVNGDAAGVDTDSGPATATLGASEIQQLPDDPDDLLRELQALASSNGGDPSSAQISVDGFQNSSAMPPKSAIASVRVNPDIFSAEYQRPLWHGGLVEVTTKPGADTLHGALFYTNSNGVFNATDPFSLTATPAGKQRYGFELSGPIVHAKSGFALALEKRDIDEFNIVNAVTLDSSGDPSPFEQTVPAPERLWIASARGDWQATSRDVVTASFSTNINTLGNQGIGGLVLPEAGYSNRVSEDDLRFTNTCAPSPNLLDQTRIGYTWKRTEQSPLSTAPSLQVAGYFTGGGATSQNLNDRERDLEIDHAVMITRGKQEIRFGAQSIGIFMHDFDPNTFNGAYVFGGGSAPVLGAGNNPTGQTTAITGIEQYRRALLNLPGGAPTTYQITTGAPLVPFTLWQFSLYAQDSIKLRPRLTLSKGLRYQLQTSPDSFRNFRPRLGIAWSPDRNERWVIYLRFGLFSPYADPSVTTEVYRVNGMRQQETLVYSPGYANPLTPIPRSIAVSNINQFAPRFGQVPGLQFLGAVEYAVPDRWKVHAAIGFGLEWEWVRMININAPMVASETGAAPDPASALLAPRPMAPNENIEEYRNDGHNHGAFWVVDLDHHAWKHYTVKAGFWHLNFTDENPNPQSSYSRQGEFGRPWWMYRDGFNTTQILTLPYKVEVSAEFDTRPGIPYDVTTGTDANGDGSFTDRPSYASAPGPGVYATHYGLMTANTVNGNVPFDSGTMPRTMHFDANLSRAFTLNPKDKDHPPTLTLNARSANLLNYKNVTAVNTVLTSGAVGQPIAAESARRLELGARFSF